jgi:transcriptional regulator of heat shock response
MINRNVGHPTNIFWNCVGISLIVLSVGMAWAITRTKVFELELAQYKFRTGNAMSKIQEVSNTLEHSAKILPITAQKKEQIIEQLDLTNEVIEQATNEVEDLEKLIEP